ncbi:hypothetical protein T07_7011 [Trichinella nelsoni]|uniref:Uncharacterized protein n=1 Tax=Trichinella nelsoni TaxID=6336 RepID=A0A0V0RYK3_9BILA|nr:hypothetical protein T07_7011 [Trichinella nelsoni]
MVPKNSRFSAAFSNHFFSLVSIFELLHFSFFLEIFIFFFQYNNHRAYSSTIFDSAAIRFATKLVGLVSAQLLLFSKINESIKREKKNLFIQLAMLTSATNILMNNNNNTAWLDCVRESTRVLCIHVQAAVVVVPCQLKQQFKV